MSITSRPTDHSPDEIRSRLEELRKDFGELPEAEKRSAEDSERVDKMIEEVRELDAALTLTELEDRRRRAELASTRSVGGGIERRDISSVMLSDEKFRSFCERGANINGFGTYSEVAGEADGPGLRFEGISQSSISVAAAFPPQGAMETRAFNEFTGTGPGTNVPAGNAYDPSNAGILAPLGQPIAPVPRQARLYLRDLMPSMTTTLAQVPYVRELTPTAQEQATAVGEGGLKPGAQMNFQGAVAQPTVLAATMTLSKQLFEDAPAVVQYINSRLPYILRFKEDAGFLNGSGTWPEMTGILNVTGHQTNTATASDPAVSIGLGIAKVENSDGVATGVVLNPTDAWAMFTKRASTSGVLDAGTPFSSLPLTVWGVPSYRSRAYTAGKCLVGDFQRGGLVVDREAVNVQIYRERYADTNQILVVAEERVAAAWPRPDLFVDQSL